MAATLANISDKKKLNNWFKAEMSTVITKKCVQIYVESEIETFQRHCLFSIQCTRHGRTHYLSCLECKTKISKTFRHDIKNAHYYANPSFENTNETEWGINAWEIAKCYMPPDGYKDKNSAADTDFNGIINVAINFKPICLNIDMEVFERARGAVNKLRHSPSKEMEDTDLQDHVVAMKDVLTNIQKHYANKDDAKDALKRLDELESLAIDVEGEMKVRSGRRETHSRNEVEQILNSTISMLQDREQQIGNVSVDVIRESLSKALDALYSIKSRDLKTDLIKYYKEVHSTVNVSPLVYENDAPIVDVYVQQEMEQVDLNIRGRRTKVDSYQAMFENGPELYHRIILMAEAGRGKTTFAKRLTNVWCYAKEGSSKRPENLSETDEETLNRFDFLFLVLLRNVPVNECNIDDIIQNQVISHLSRSCMYGNDFLKKILLCQTCLIILDGLDELPNLHQISELISYQKAGPKCTILSTTRPWKLLESRIPNSMIDMCIELKEFDEFSSDILIKNVVSILTEKTVSQKRNIDDLKAQLKKHNLSGFKATPVILIQLICLWHDNRSLGQSKCEIYSNIVDFILERAEEKDTQGNLTSHSADQNSGKGPSTLACLRENEYSNKYNPLLLAVGKLAYNALFGKGQESSLVFEFRTVNKFLSDEQLHVCLQIGILTENRLIERVSERRMNYSFMHKSFQEYFCAFYLASLERNDCTGDIQTKCRAIETVLDLSGVFVFLSGLNPKTLIHIFDSLSDVILKDQLFQRFRCKISTSVDWSADYKMLKKLQDMYIECRAENNESGNITLRDCVIDEDCQNKSYSEHLRHLVSVHKEQIKSVKLYIEPNVDITFYIQDFHLTELKHLDKLEIIVDTLNDNDLKSLLIGSANTLKCLSICKDIGSQIDPPCNLLSRSSIRTIERMRNLESIMLECFIVEHELLHELFSFLEKTKMAEICLAYIKCSVHDISCKGFNLDLSKHSSLTMLEVGNVPLSDVKMNTQSLNELRLGHFNSRKVLNRALCCLRNAPDLRVLMFFGLECLEDIKLMLNTLPLLATVRVLVIKRMNIGDHTMNVEFNVNHIKMSNVQMASSTFHSIVKKAEYYQHSTKFEFLSCEITPEEKCNGIMKYIEHSERFDISCYTKEKVNTYTMMFNSNSKDRTQGTQEIDSRGRKRKSECLKNA